MAEGKKGFVLYADQKLIFDDLTHEEAGILIKHIFSYVNDENPVLENRLIDMAFKPIKMQLKRDLKSWEEKQKKNIEAGKKGAAKRWGSEKLEGATEPAISHDTNPGLKMDVDFFFESLINGNEINEISRKTKIPLETLKQKIEPFRKAADLEYTSYGKFVNHFKNWALKSKDIISISTSKPVKLT